MAPETENEPLIAAIDGAVAAWRQGDCVVGEQWFVYRLEKSFSVTVAGREAAEADVDLAEQEVAGLVVVSQTCDVVRSCNDRHYVEVCPLVEVDEDRLAQIQRGRRPAYAFVPLLARKKLVADLDRVMTVEKPAVATWERTPGLSTDEEARAFAAALGRKRTRFAFPDDFTSLVKKLQARLADKHDRNTDEGRGLRALREIRVQAAPQWDGEQVDLFFWFIRNAADANFEGKNWADLLKGWLKLVTPSGRFRSIEGHVATLDDMTAREYVDSDPLDLDNISTGAAQ